MHMGCCQVFELYHNTRLLRNCQWCYTSKNGHEELAMLLLDHKADINKLYIIGI